MAFVQIDSVKTHYVDRGSGPALVLVHGFPETLDTWRHNLPELSKNFRVIAFDMVGFGQTDRADWDYSCTGLAAFIHKLLLQLKITRTHIVGTDTGASAALAYAAQYQDSVDKFVFLSGTPYANSIGSVEVNLMTCPVLGDIGFLLFGDWLLPYVLRKGFFRPDKLEKAVLRSYAGYLRSFRSKKIALKLMRDANINIGPHLKKLIESCPPTLILWADHERYFRSWVPEKLHRDLKNSRLEYVADCGHFIQEEQPLLFNRKIIEFLTS